MKLPAVQNFVCRRPALAISAGLALAAAFPRPGLAGLAWVAPGLLLMAGLGSNGAARFRIGYAGGLAYYLASLYWLLFIPFPLGAVTGWLALSAYLALYPACWVWLSLRLLPSTPPDSPTGGTPRSMPTFLPHALFQRAVWSLGCAAIWVALEMIVARAFTGFPWNLLGASQYRMLPLIQIASITGVYGVSFLAVWFSVALGCFAVQFLARPSPARFWFGDLTMPLLAVGLVAAFGVGRIRQSPGAANTLRVALVQPSIPQTLIWDPKENTNRFHRLLQLSEEALAAKPDLLIWPEAAVPNMLRHDADTSEAVRSLVRRHHVWLILGADDAEPRPGSTRENEYDFYNSSFLINPNGEIAGTYRKQQLVPFGEFIPFVRWFPFLKFLAPIGDGFAAGDRPVPFHLPPLGVHTAVLICFEDTFPNLARQSVQSETDFLLNLTNDGWFSESAAQWQHAACAVFRAVENGLPLVRCANNGLSCWIDALGGLHETGFPNSPNVYQAGVKIVRIPVLAEGEKRTLTFYQRHGDWFAWTCVGFAAGMLLVRQFSTRSRAPRM